MSCRWSMAGLAFLALVLPAYAQRDVELTVTFKNADVAEIQMATQQLENEGSLRCSQPSTVVVKENATYTNRCVASARGGRRNLELKGEAKVVCPPSMRTDGACNFSFSFKFYPGSHKFSYSRVGRKTENWNCPGSGRCLVAIAVGPLCWQGCGHNSPPPPWHPTR